VTLVPRSSWVIAAIAIAALFGARAGEASDGDRYIDRNHLFSFSMPRFTPSEQKNASTVAVTLAAAASAGFAPNVNVVVHNIDTTLDAYQELQQQELSAVGWQLLEQSRITIDGTPTLRTHARGSTQGLEIEFLAVTILREGKKKAYVLTCTATTEQFPDFQAEFDRVISSFALEP